MLEHHANGGSLADLELVPVSCPELQHLLTATVLPSPRRQPDHRSAISPVICHSFLHYAFDAWMAREHPGVQFERYVDDAVVHCVSERQTQRVLASIAERMQQVGLRLHPAKTRIVYCQDDRRRASYEHTEFTFLGFPFRQRRTRNKDGRQFSSFNPVIRGWMTYYGRSSAR